MQITTCDKCNKEISKRYKITDYGNVLNGTPHPLDQIDYHINKLLDEIADLCIPCHQELWLYFKCKLKFLEPLLPTTCIERRSTDEH